MPPPQPPPVSPLPASFDACALCRRRRGESARAESDVATHKTQADSRTAHAHNCVMGAATTSGGGGGGSAGPRSHRSLPGTGSIGAVFCHGFLQAEETRELRTVSCLPFDLWPHYPAQTASIHGHILIWSPMHDSTDKQVGRDDVREDQEAG
jgi:hypothetical protein